MRKRHDDRLRAGIESDRTCAEKRTDDGDAYRQPERAEVPAKRLRESVDKPVNGRETVRPFAGLMNFTIRPRNQRFQVTAGLWFGGKRRDFRQVR